MNNKKKILLIVCAIAICIIGYGWYMYNKPVASIEHKSSDFTLTASQIIQEYEKDEAVANTKFLDKIIEVEGTVGKIQNNNIYLITDNPLSSIICEMSEEQLLSGIKEGDNIHLKGVCTGYLLDVVLVRCTLINK